LLSIHLLINLISIIISKYLINQCFLYFALLNKFWKHIKIIVYNNECIAYSTGCHIALRFQTIWV
jgi:hypothetical protein